MVKPDFGTMYLVRNSKGTQLKFEIPTLFLSSKREPSAQVASPFESTRQFSNTLRTTPLGMGYVRISSARAIVDPDDLALLRRGKHRGAAVRTPDLLAGQFGTGAERFTAM